MGTEVLRPQDCLIERIRVAPVVFPRRKSYHGNARPNNCRKPVVRPERVEQKKRFTNLPEPAISKRSWSSEDLRTKNLAMGQVTILRRGESLDSKIKSDQNSKNGDDLIVCGTERLGPEPEMVPKQIRIKDMKNFLSPSARSVDRSDKYAGSAFSLSPSPRSLPLPSFFNKKQISKTIDDSATRDLRRLLRLD